MALDTDTRKFSAVNLSSPWRGVGAIPDGALGEEEWFSIVKLYNEFAAAEAGDTTPDAFSFTDQTDVARSTVITSAPITVAGIDTATDISVTGGEYSINGGAFTSSPGVGAVVNGDEIRARHTSSASYSTATNTAVTIGGVSDTFTSTTLAGVTVPDVDDPGTDEATAIAAIEAENLVARTRNAHSQSVAEGLVISQSPASGVEVDAGSTVTITISRGPEGDGGSGFIQPVEFIGFMQ